ncbi:LON peptidase substrate-binding domain-containing protein [Elongatibacter sediminis]|uniref:LON peptidase substrate-binding domain-containing protein n=1 Tax=Elongatibacter sediminis TaxID=3119006 RepID=A0AAW9RIT8_9GAMM
MTEIPLFPLRTVLFPDGYLPLRIFEQRYLDMVRECARTDTGFGVCLILEGEEAIAPVKPAQVGTLAQIIDWYTLDDGLLGVSAVGTSRFVLQQAERREDGLLVGSVTWLPEPSPIAVPEPYSVLSQVLGRFMEKVGERYPSFSEEQLDDAVWVGYRLAELLPLAAVEKQHLLELSDPLERLQNLVETLPRFQSE